MFLLDTNIISELRRPRPNRAVVRWIEEIPTDQLHLSSVTIGELQAGIEITREQDQAKAVEMEGWLKLVRETFSVLPADAAAFIEWARLMHRQSDTLTLDALIAAVAAVNSLTVVSRNVRDFEQLGVPVLNPFDHTN